MFYASVFTIMHNNEKKKNTLNLFEKQRRGGGAAWGFQTYKTGDWK